MKAVDKITITELSEMAEKMYGSLVKAVVDLKKDLLVVDAEMHVDEEQYLLESGSQQADLWGINLYPSRYGKDDFIEFDSMINIRPSAKNMSRWVDDKTTQKLINELVSRKVINE
jgi:Protein of unknown function (DUF5674)